MQSTSTPALKVVKPASFKLYGRPLAEIISDLSRPLPERFLSHRKQGGKNLTYVNWHDVNKLMDYFTGGGWEGSVTNVHTTQDEVYVTYKVTIHALEGHLSREATGSEKLANDSWGEAIAKAEAQAFKRSCARFGLALYLYDG